MRFCAGMEQVETYSRSSKKNAGPLPKEVEHWSLTTLRQKLVKIGAKVVSHGRYSECLLGVQTV